MEQQGIQARGMLPVHTHITPEEGGQINADDLFYGCAVRAYRGAQQVIANNTTTKVLFDTENYDIGGDFDADGVDSNFTVPDTGYYFLQSLVTLVDLADTNLARIYIYNDGASIAESYQIQAGASHLSLLISTSQLLVAGALIDIRVFHLFGANRNVMAGSPVSFFTIFKLGE